MALSLDSILILLVAALIHVTAGSRSHGGSYGSYGDHHRGNDRDDGDDGDDYDNNDGEGGMGTGTMICLYVGGGVLLLVLVAGVVIGCCKKAGSRAAHSGKTSPIHVIQVDDSQPPAYSTVTPLPMDPRPPPYDMPSNFMFQLPAKHANAPPQNVMYKTPSPTPSAASLPNSVDDDYPPYLEK